MPTVDFYKATETTAKDLEGLCRDAAVAIAALTPTQKRARTSTEAAGKAENWPAALAAVLRLPAVEKLLLHISRVHIFTTDLHRGFAHNLVLLGQLKKLKYWYVLPQSTFLHCINGMVDTLGQEAPELAAHVDAAFASPGGQAHVRVVCRKEGLKSYLDNEQELEKAEPHAVYPTSTFRSCDGQVLATEDGSLIEGVMSTTITTTIKILTGVLDPENSTLREMYAPLGRCVAVVDQHVEALYGERIEAYFAKHSIPLTKLVVSGMEAGKSMEAVGHILKTLKTHLVARNEPVLIVGGGVVSDLGGFATALYDRNTPYVMLCTSIVAGIDAGPSPRTCANDYGYKNLYGAFHPPVLTLTDRTLWSTLHEGWLRHGIAEIIKMAVVKDFSLFELLEGIGPRLISSKFGTKCPEDAEFGRKCDLIVGKAMHSYVRSEYGNLWETHQCRPHAYGHTWSPGYELPAGMLHGHAVATCMGYGAFLAMQCDFINKQQLERIMRLISNFELSLWHPIMDNADRIWDCNTKIIAKRGGNLCAPVPRGEIGQCGYIQQLTKEQVASSIKEYKALCETFPRGGCGVDPLCVDVGLEDPSATIKDKAEIPDVKELQEENARLQAQLAAVKKGCSCGAC